MSKKYNIISMSIINGNEANYSDCVQILRTYETWIAEIYEQAGLLQATPNIDNPLIPVGPAAPGQINAHTNFTENDPMQEIKIIFAGDHLTRVATVCRRKTFASWLTYSFRPHGAMLSV